MDELRRQHMRAAIAEAGVADAACDLLDAIDAQCGPSGAALEGDQVDAACRAPLPPGRVIAPGEYERRFAHLLVDDETGHPAR